MTVEFESSVVDPIEFPSDKPIPALPRFIIRLGLAKDENQANIILIIFSVIFMAIAIYLFQGLNTNASSSLPSLEPPRNL